jgi:hypothetical protein
LRVVRALRKVVVTPSQLPGKSTYLVPTIISEGEHVLFLGQVDNMNGSIAVATWDGNVLWPLKHSDFGEVDEHLPSGQGSGQGG